MAATMRRPEPGLSAIDPSDGTIRGTGIEANRIAALAKGSMDRHEILADYPGLTSEQIDAALEYDSAFPNLGEPFPERTAKSAMGSNADALGLAYGAARDR